MKILVHLVHEVRAFHLSDEQLASLGAQHPALRFVRCATEDEFLGALPTAHGALVWHFDAAWYERAPELRLVATPAAGRERVAPDPSGRVRLVYGAFHGQIMAETLVGMVSYWARRFDLAESQQRERRYERDAFSSTRRLAEQSALVVGYGPLGRRCAASLKALGMHVAGVKRNAAVDPAPADAVYPASELFTVLGAADHVVVTLPSDTGADHLFDDRAFSAMKPGACFYSLGRGNVVDESALVRALEQDSLGGAFLDVFEREPLPADSPLWSAPRLRLLPHASAISRHYLDLWFAELAPELARLGAGQAGTPRVTSAH